jgi:catechol 2,3-dioxygenase-like lactoylglutathione lyase family enzyme
MTVKRMDNVGIVVEDIDAAIEFFTELGLELEGRAPIEGDWAEGVTGLRDMRVEIAMMRTPDGHSRLELSRFLAPPVVADHRSAPVNALGYLRIMFTVENVDDTLARLGKRGAELVGEVVQYEDRYRLCYIRGPEGILIGLAQELGQHNSDDIGDRYRPSKGAYSRWLVAARRTTPTLVMSREGAVTDGVARPRRE